MASVHEEWRPLAGKFEGWPYEISNRGRLRRCGNQTAAPHRFNEHGYAYRSISRKKINRNAKIHRLVAEAFIPNPLCKGEVNHIDGDKSNNVVENLEWCSRQENFIHATRLGLLKGRTRLPQSTNLKIVEAYFGGLSINATASHFGVSVNRVRTIVRLAAEFAKIVNQSLVQTQE